MLFRSSLLNTTTPLPNVVDLRPYASPIDDQGSLGSCTGNACAGAIDLMDKKLYNRNTRVSRLFIYYYERYLEGTVNYDSGAYVRDAIRATYNYGAPLDLMILPAYWSDVAPSPSISESVVDGGTI